MTERESGGPLIWTDPIGPFADQEEANQMRDALQQSSDGVNFDLNSGLIWSEIDRQTRRWVVRVGKRAKTLLGDRWGERIYPRKESDSSSIPAGSRAAKTASKNGDPMPDLFTFLSRYRVGERKTSWEDFLTQAFAWLMDRNRALCVELFSELADVAFNIDRLTIATQVSYGGSRIDMELSDGEHHIFLESKLGASVATYGNVESGPKNQIEKYIEILRSIEGHGEKLVLLVSQHSDAALNLDCQANELRTVLWNDIRRILARNDEKVVPAWKPLLLEFVSFLEGMGMTDFKGLSNSDVVVARAIEDTYSRVRRLLEDAMSGAGLERTTFSDADEFRGAYLKHPKGAWLGISYWGAGFGNVIAGIQSEESSLSNKLAGVGFEASGRWGENWWDRQLPFSDYASRGPDEQVKVVTHFLKDVTGQIEEATGTS